MNNFQTPLWVCEIMVALVDGTPRLVLEPTPGDGNLHMALKSGLPSSDVVKGTGDFMAMPIMPVDWIVANPPFTPMRLGYAMLERFFEYTPNVIVLMPWLVIINSTQRTRRLVDSGLSNILHLPREAFPGARVQTCILKFKKDYQDLVIIGFPKKPTT